MLIYFYFLFFSLAFTQYHSQEWESITSFLTPTGIQVDFEGIIYATTAGGLLSLNLESEKFTYIKGKDGLVYYDLSTIAIDNFGRLWLGGSYPRGYLQIYDPRYGLIKKITHLDIHQIDKIQIKDDFAFSIFEGSNNSEIGILEFIIDDYGLPEYKDYYINISDNPITEIRDLDIFLDSIYVTTDQGIFSANYKYDNLKYKEKWLHIFSGDSAIQYLPEIKMFVSDNSLFLYNGINWIEKNSGLTGKIISAQLDEGVISVLTDCNYFEIQNDNISYQFEMPEISHSKGEFSTFSKLNDYTTILGLKNSGMIHLNILTNQYRIFIPDTPAQNRYQALTITSNGSVAAASEEGILIWDDDKSKNFQPWQFTTNYPIRNLDKNGIQYSWTHLSYRAGEQFPISIVEKSNGNLIYCNSGSMPNSSGFLDVGAIIELDILSKNYIPYGTENNILDGWWGKYSLGNYSEYMLVNQIKEDKLGNIWITNPFCEKYGNLLAIQRITDNSWSHVKVPDSSSFRPQSIAFDRLNRIWLGFAYDALEDKIYSNGGIKILKYSDLNFSDINDSTWLNISNLELLPGSDEDASVWSIVFDKMDFLWVLNEKGIRGYIYSMEDDVITLDPILKSIDLTPIDFLSHLSYTKGNRIKVDSQNNKWIITHHGVWVIQESMMFWPSQEGLNENNSGLLSNIVYDIAFDDDQGLAYLATEKGISVLQIPFSENPHEEESMYISPNPFIIPDNEFVIIKNMPAGSHIKIVSINGALINEFKLDSNKSQINWNGKDVKGNLVGTAVYIVSAFHESEKNQVSKLAIVRK